MILDAQDAPCAALGRWIEAAQRPCFICGLPGCGQFCSPECATAWRRALGQGPPPAACGRTQKLLIDESCTR